MAGIRKEYLMTPGPTTVPPEVLQKGALPVFHHRTPRFSDIVKETGEGLKYLFCTRNDVYTLTSSGTGAMEAAVANLLSIGDTAISIETGKFGERWTKLLKTYGINPVVINVPYGDFVTPERLEETLLKNPSVKAVFTQLSETSTGVVLDIEGFGKVVRKTDAVLVVDGISGIGAIEFKMDDWNVDVAVAASQKGIMLPPGLAFISVSDKAWKLVEKSRSPRFYFDLIAARECLSHSQTTWTPAVTLFAELAESLKIIRNETLEAAWKRHAYLAEAVRSAIGALGLKLFAKRPGNILTSVEVPDEINGDKLIKDIRDRFGVTFADGQGVMKGKIFRIGHLGWVDKMDIIVAIAAIEMALKESAYPVMLGKGVAAAEEVLSNEGFDL